MRYLFTSMPVSSHLMPLVPLAHAALAAGHEVLVATGGPAARTARAAGLVTVEAGERLRAREPYEDLLRMLERGEAGTAADDATAFAVHGRAFGEVGARMLDDLIGIARTWGADAVVYPGIHSAALIAARAVGVPAVLHGYGTPLPTFGPALEHLAPHAARAGVEKVWEAEIEIDVLPPSLSNFTEVPTDIGRPEHVLRMRYGCFNNGGDLPRWALERGDRPRVTATCGSAATMTREARCTATSCWPPRSWARNWCCSRRTPSCRSCRSRCRRMCGRSGGCRCGSCWTAARRWCTTAARERC